MHFNAFFVSVASLFAFVHAGYLGEDYGHSEHDDGGGAALYGDFDSHYQHQASEESFGGADEEGISHFGHDFASYADHGVSLNDFASLSGGYEHTVHSFGGGEETLQQHAAQAVESQGFDFHEGGQFDGHGHSEFGALSADDFKFESDTGGQSEWKPIHGWN